MFTDFINVTKFIESMSKHDGNVTHTKCYSARKVVETANNTRCASVRIGWLISALINCHHSLFVLRHTFPNQERKSFNDDCNDNYDDDHVHVITIVTSSVSGASIVNVAARFLTPLKEGRWEKTNGNTVMYFLKRNIKTEHIRFCGESIERQAK